MGLSQGRCLGLGGGECLDLDMVIGGSEWPFRTNARQLEKDNDGIPGLLVCLGCNLPVITNKGPEALTEADNSGTGDMPLSLGPLGHVISAAISD